MIYIALGGNLPSRRFGGPRATLEAALAALESRGGALRRCSRWYRSAPVPASDQPWFVNAVAEIESDLDPEALLQLLHAVEEDFGRVRSLPNAARIVDLDLIDYHGKVTAAGSGLTLPHPRMHERAFVLLPLADLAPRWRHPASGAVIDEMIAELAADQMTEVMDE